MKRYTISATSLGGYVAARHHGLTHAPLLFWALAPLASRHCKGALELLDHDTLPCKLANNMATQAWRLGERSTMLDINPLALHLGNGGA